MSINTNNGSQIAITGNGALDISGVTIGAFIDGDLTIKGGTVNFIGDRYGIAIKSGNVTTSIGSNVQSVVASGEDRAVTGVVKNEVVGIGWTNADGTEGKAFIDTIAEGKELRYAKKVQFPAPIAEVTPPEARDLTYNGSAQELVTPGQAVGGTMCYALGENDKSIPQDGWSEEVPKGMSAKTYYVWYMAVGDASHFDSQPECVTAMITPPTVSIAYAGHEQGVGDLSEVTNGQVLGVVGESKRLEEFSARIEGIDGSVSYRAHLQRTGWTDTVRDGEKCGTEGEGRRIEAIQMQLEGVEGYHAWYRVHTQTFGWLGWAHDGQPAGTAGQSKRVEALEIQVLPDGQTPEDYVDGQASYLGAVTGNTHQQGTGWTGERSSLTFGTTGQSQRIESIELSLQNQPLPGGIEYEVHVQREGWIGAAHDGQIAGTVGQSRRIEAVRIQLTGEMAMSGQYSVWYRVHSQRIGWLGWAHDGEDAGTTGLSRRAEAIDVQILPQGQRPDVYDASMAASLAS